MQRDLAILCTELAERCRSRDDHDAAARYVKSASGFAKAALDPTTASLVTDARDALARQVRSHQAAQQAWAKLATQPDDPSANRDAGVFECLYRGDWYAGLTRLRRAGDGLAALAVRDLAMVANARAQLALGRSWWTYAQAHDDRFRSRAIDWIKAAWPHLSRTAQTDTRPLLEAAGLAGAGVDGHHPVDWPAPGRAVADPSTNGSGTPGSGREPGG